MEWRSSSLALNIGCLSAVAAYVVHSMVDFNLHIPANSMLMAFVFGVLANPGLETFQAKRPGTMLNYIFQGILPILGLAILFAGIPKIPCEYFSEKARVSLRDGKTTSYPCWMRRRESRGKRKTRILHFLTIFGEARRNLGDAFPPPANATFYHSASEAFKQGLELFPAG